MSEARRPSTTKGLGLLALLAFVTSFVTARGFATFNPDVVVVAGGVHFHHFWYGLAMVLIAGWMGITSSLPRFRRVYAVLFGLGGGLMGDEIGLFLTFGNYNSSLTLFFFILVVCAGSALILAKDRKEIESDIIGLKKDEALLLIGAFVVGVSSLEFGAGFLGFGILLVGGGFAAALISFALGQRSSPQR